MSQTPAQPLTTREPLATLPLLAIAAAVTLLHLLTNSRYGFHRDELQFLSDARHLAWGYVSYPPLTPFVERLSMSLFDLNMVGLRLASVLAQAAAILVTGLMARELGGTRLAQIAAATAVALSPLPIFEGTEFQYTTFDFLWWVLIAFFVLRLLRTENPRYWLAIGAVIGLGLMTKYAIVLYIASLILGLVLTPNRRYLLNRWFWAGVALTLLIVLPNLLWQLHHHFIALDFTHQIHVRDVGEGRAQHFFRGQFLICTNPFTAPLWIAGFIAFLRDRRYRLLGWMALLTVALFALAQGRDYYTAAVYPMLFAMGAVAATRWLATLRPAWRRTIEAAYFTTVIAFGLLACAALVPIATAGPLQRFALAQSGDLREETGWPELLQQVARIRDSLPAAQQPNTAVLVDNYGEAGAIEILGPPYHLGLPLSGTNSAWLRGYPDPTPTTLIVLGMSFRRANRLLTNCRLAGHNTNPYGLKNEESEDHPDIFLCGPPRQPWPIFWKDFQNFG